MEAVHVRMRSMLFGRSVSLKPGFSQRLLLVMEDMIRDATSKKSVRDKWETGKRHQC
jgi:hypothetical protein